MTSPSSVWYLIVNKSWRLSRRFVKGCTCSIDSTYGGLTSSNKRPTWLLTFSFCGAGSTSPCNRQQLPSLPGLRETHCYTSSIKHYAHYLCRYISLSSQITHLNASGLFPFDAPNLFAFRSSETTYMFASVHPPSRHIRYTRSTTWFIIGFPCSRKAWFCSKTYNLLQDWLKSQFKNYTNLCL